MSRPVGRPGGERSDRVTEPVVSGRWRVGTAIAIAVVTGSCAGPTSAPGTAAAVSVELPLTDLDVVVTSVSDGDSFRAEAPAGEIEVRLLGLNAPELDECHGRLAKEALGAMIDGHSIGLASEPARDQFDRVLARAVVEATYVNVELVLKGHGVVLSGDAPDRELLLEAEEIARAGGTGMWASDVCGAVGVPPAVEIIAIDHDPPGSDEDESVTLANTGDTPLDLEGFVLRDESSLNRFEFPSIEIAPGGDIVIVSGCQRNDPGTLTWCADQPVWNNEGDTALLLDRAGRIVAFHRYWLTSGE